jgi:SAM-dependent methyltransferase
LDFCLLPNLVKRAGAGQTVPTCLGSALHNIIHVIKYKRQERIALNVLTRPELYQTRLLYSDPGTGSFTLSKMANATSAKPTFNFNIHPLSSNFAVPYKTYLSKHHFISELVPVGIKPKFVCTGAVVFDGSTIPRILLVQRAASDSMPNLWEVPGGACDEEDPSILYGVARELWEEAGLKAAIIGPQVGKGHPFFTRSGNLVVKYTFLVEPQKDTNGKLEVNLDVNEHQKYVWATEEEVIAKKVADIQLRFTAPAQERDILEGFKLREMLLKLQEIDSAKETQHSDPTFRSYTKEQGITYAQSRGGYPPKLYQLVMDRHLSTGGQLNYILDVGCGPGTTIRELASTFAHAAGLDPSEGMISTARSLGGTSSWSSAPEPIQFQVSTAEDLGSNLSSPIPDASIDLITASTAAHWFDMSKFWPRAAQVLKPGGTVAIWTFSSWYPHPSMPNGAAIAALMEEFSKVWVGPYQTAGNHLVRDLYSDLPLPWTIPNLVPEFDKETYYRKEWNKNGKVEDGEQFFMGQFTTGLDATEKFFDTISPVTRWREANPDKTGEEDIVRKLMRGIERLLHEAGVEKGKEALTGGVAGVLLMVKKKV